MYKPVLFIHGAGDEGYELDKKLVATLRPELGKAYDIAYPHIQTNEDAPDFEWPQQIGKEISAVKEGVILVGHSLGASMLLKYLSENKIQAKIAGIFLLATPFWSGSEEWKKGLMLQAHFEDSLPGGVPLYFYHCRDDEEVPFSHLELYRQRIKQATYRELEHGGHQLNSDLAVVANDIKSL